MPVKPKPKIDQPKYKVGQTYYKLIDAFDVGVSSNGGRWKISTFKVLGETKKTVIVDGFNARKKLEVNKPWIAHVSQWDAVAEKIAELDREENHNRQEADSHAKYFRDVLKRIEAEKEELVNFRNQLSED